MPMSLVSSALNINVKWKKQDSFQNSAKSHGLTMSVYHTVQNANREQSTLKQLFSVELKQPDPQWKDKKKIGQTIRVTYF